MAVLENTRIRSDPWLGLVAVSVAAALWAVGAAVASTLFDDGVTPLELVQARSYITTVGLAFIPAAWRSPSRGFRSQARLLVGLGLAIALVNLTYYVAIDRIPVAVAIVLQYSAPAMIVTWSIVSTRERPSAPVLAALCSALAGVVLVSDVLRGSLADLDLLGIAMGLGAAIMFATYTVLSERAQDTMGPVAAIFRGFAIASVFWVLIQLPRGWPDALVEPANLPRVLLVGVGATLLPFLLYVWGVGRLRAARASIAATLEPVLAAVIAWIWLGQTLSITQVLGGLLVIVAVVLLQVRPEGPRPQPEV